MHSGACGAILEIPPCVYLWPNPEPHESGRGTVYAGRFDWGGLLLKSNGGAQWLVQRGWKPRVECKSTSQLYCESYRTNSLERGL